MKRGAPLRRKTPLQARRSLARGTTQLKRTGRLKFRSKKQEAAYRKRRKVLADMAADGPPMCFVPGCNRWADDGHELLSRGRGGSITDPANIRPVCRPHHNQITTNPAWAEANGYALPSPRKDTTA